jgi:NADPH:quinone reductase-like Zn-dependent oxidoreductase
LKPGDRVYGVVPTSRSGGAHRDILAVESELVRLVPAEVDFGSVAILPYTFCTLWKAIQGLRIRPDAISGKRILIVGASGALGQMATQLLSSWGASITALCSEPHMELCRSLGASEVVDRFAHSIAELPSDYDVTLNFGSWAHEVPLLERLKRGAIGHATTLHPLLSQLDEHGWISGGWGARRQWSKMHGLLQSRSPDALYRWTVFRPDTSALDVLAELVNRQAMHLKVGMTVPFIDAKVAFDHVDFGNPTRAILFPGHRSPS